MARYRKPKRPALKPHEERFVEGARLGCATEGDYEVSVPRGAARIDAVFDVGGLGGFFGPLEPLMTHRVVGFEAYSGSLPHGWFADACLKAGWLVKRWRREPAPTRHGTRPPLMVVVAAGRFPWSARTALYEPMAPGIWRSRLGSEVEVILVELAAVPLEIGTTGLHMLRLPSNHERAHVLDAFIEDPTIDLEIRTNLKEAIMSGTFQASETEYRTVSERVRAEGFAEGERQGERRGERRGLRRGIEQGVAQARYSLIERVRTLLGDEAAASLEDIADFDVLSARAFEMMAERR